MRARTAENSMRNPAPASPSRRKLIKTAAAAGIAAGIGPFFHARPARAARTLRILQWRHFVPGFDRWFNNDFAKAWGQENDTEVIVDNLNFGLIPARAAAEAAAQQGHDLVMLLTPPAVYEDQVADMKDVYAECEKRHGKPIDLAVKSTCNPKTGKCFAFSASFVPALVNYRTDLWDDIGMMPDTWENVRVGGARIKTKSGIPVGIGLANELDSAMAIRAVMYAFGAHEQDAEGNLVINSRNTLEALKFVKALYREAMTPDVLSWDPSSNNRHMLAGQCALALNAISITRAGENAKLDIHKKIGLAAAAKGPARRIGLPNVMECYVIWKFSRNIDGAKKFLADYVGKSSKAFMARGFYNLPCFAKTVPDLKAMLAKNPKAVPPGKYAVLNDALALAANVGYPGHANAAIGETFANWTLNTMFAKAATGAETPADALAAAEKAMRAIWQKWKERKLI